jgi:hypothetical protein
MILAAAVLAIGLAEERIPNKQIQHVARFLLKKRVHEIRVSGIWTDARKNIKHPLASSTSERRPEVIQKLLLALTRSTRELGNEGPELWEEMKWSGTFYFVWKDGAQNRMLPFNIDTGEETVGKEVAHLLETYFVGPPVE